MEQFQNIQVIIDPEVAGINFDVRRPYFRMRGRPVTEEQAFDIIRRTDTFFRFDLWQYKPEDLVSDRFVLDNIWYSPQFCPHPRSWVRPNGLVGMNGITGKYPTEEEFLESVLPLKEAFPYLDLMIAVTDWNEAPEHIWDMLFDTDESKVFSPEDYPDFPEHIVYGIWLHDDKVELMAPARARETYLEYDRLYGGENEAIFTMNYYEDHGILPADLEYLRRCIRSHGLDPDEALASYEWTPSGLKKKR